MVKSIPALAVIYRPGSKISLQSRDPNFSLIRSAYSLISKGVKFSPYEIPIPPPKSKLIILCPFSINFLYKIKTLLKANLNGSRSVI